MSRVNAEVTRSTKSAVVRRQFYFIAYNGKRLCVSAVIEKLMLTYKQKQNGTTKLD